MDIKELYQEIVLDHGKNPRNKNRCEGYNKDAKGHNPLCGDKVHVFIKLDNETLKWQQWAKNIKCCTPNEFYLINTSFNKKIQFTLQVEWHNHYHTKIRTSSNCYQCKYTKKERNLFAV